MTDVISLRAGARRIDIANSSREAVKLTAWDWGNPDSVPTLADGVDGGVRVGGNDLEQARPLSFEVSSTYGNVAGFDGLAINRVGGRDAVSQTTGSAGVNTLPAWVADTSDLMPALVDFGCEVWSSVATTASVKVSRDVDLGAAVTVAVPAEKWVPIAAVGRSTTGTGNLTMTASCNGPAGTFKARLPHLGQGLQGVYHDRYTPGARTPGAVTGRAVRWANGERFANEVLTGLAEAVGAVHLEGAPVLIRSGDGWTTTWTFDLHKVSVSASQDGEHHMGYLTAKLAMQARPDARLDPITIPGTLTNTTVGAMPVWQPDTAITGDLPAIAEVTATWADTRRDALAAVATAQPVALQPSPLLSTWTTGALSGGLGAAGVSGFCANTQVPVAQFTVPAGVDGRCLVDVRANVTNGAPLATATEPVALVINGRVAARTVVEPFRDFAAAWRWATFGAFTVRPGDVLQVMLGSSTAIQAGVDILTLTPAGPASAKITIPGNDIPSGTMVGDDFPNTAGGSLNGRTALFGSSWSASGWDWEYGAASPSSAGGSAVEARLAAEKTLGTDADHLAIDGRVTFKETSIGPTRVGLQCTSDGRSILVSRTGTGPMQVVVSTASASTTRTIDAPVGVALDFRIQLDRAGRVIVMAATSGRRLSQVLRMHVPALAGGTYKASAVATGKPSVSLASLRFVYGTVLPYSSQVTWAAGQTGRLIEGGTPRLEPGTRPRIFVRAAATAIDSPSAPHPTAVTVKVTRRVLQVPR